MEITLTTLAIILALVMLALLIRRIYRIFLSFDIEKSRETVWDRLMELAFIYLLPGLGLWLVRPDCGERPFEAESIVTTCVMWILFALGHFLSRNYKQRLSPLALLVASSLMIIGVAFNTVICIHFAPFVFLSLIPGWNLLYLSALFCGLYLLRELYHLNIYLKEMLDERKLPGIKSAENLYERFGFPFYLAGPLLVLIQGVLYLVGQKPDSLITQFTGSCGFLLSNYQDCSCGGDHYLCSIAANGNKKLVKPLRFGLRQNQKIVVNRQLLVANAFENWMEEYTPRLHRFARKTYDGMGIPVNAWAKRRRLANLLYVLMKPLEWLFLFWLYLADQRPENRIAQQYLPKKEIERFIKTQQL
jgi:hypothetical protein